MALRIIPRAEWGARFGNGAGSAPMPATEVWLHHSVTASAGAVATFEQDAATVRNLESIGQTRFGAGISYTWLVCKSGRVFEGHSPNREGTHTGGRNDRARAICFIGNYDSDEPTAAQLNAAAELLKVAKANGWIKTARLNGGHRDVKATACPGAKAYAKIGTINTAAASSAPPVQEDDMAEPEEIATAIVDALMLRKTGQVSNEGHEYNVLDTFVGNNKGEWAGVDALNKLVVATDKTNEKLDKLIAVLSPTQPQGASEGDQE